MNLFFCHSIKPGNSEYSDCKKNDTHSKSKSFRKKSKTKERNGLQNKDYLVTTLVHSRIWSPTNLVCFFLLERISYHSN